MSNTVGFNVTDAKRIADTVKSVERDRPAYIRETTKNGSVDDFIWAEITAAGDGSNAGRYEWSAIQFDSVDGTANSNYGSGTYASNWAIEINGATLEVGDKVLLRPSYEQEYMVGSAGGGGGSSCASQNAIVQITVFGSPTGGTLDLNWTIDSTSDTLTFDSTADSTAFKTELVTHPGVDTTAECTVTGGPFPDATIQVEFTGDLAATDVPLPLSNWSALTGGTGVGMIQYYSQPGIA